MFQTRCVYNEQILRYKFFIFDNSHLDTTVVALVNTYSVISILGNV